MNKPHIQIILGSSRDGRLGERVATWLTSETTKVPEATFELLDLKDQHLPILEESGMPFMHQYTDENTKRWSETISKADGYIIVTPEYNYAPPAVLKNALDLLYTEWNRKPVAFVSYSNGAFGGVRAVDQLAQIAFALQLAPLRFTVPIPKAQESINEDGTLANEQLTKSFAKMKDELLWWTNALKTAREQTPAA